MPGISISQEIERYLPNTIPDVVKTQTQILFNEHVKDISSTKLGNRKMLIALFIQMAYVRELNFCIPYDHILSWFNIQETGGLQQLILQHLNSDVINNYHPYYFVQYYMSLLNIPNTEKENVELIVKTIVNENEIDDKPQYVTVACLYYIYKQRFTKVNFCKLCKISGSILNRVMSKIKVFPKI